MKKKIIALAAALSIILGISGCGESGSHNSSDSSLSSANDSSGGTSSTNSGSSFSDPDKVSTKPQTVRCGDIVMENGVRVFDNEVTCGSAFAVTYHYIEGENGRIGNAIPSIKPLGVTNLSAILADPLVGGNSLSESDFKYANGVYTMNAEKAKTLLGSLTDTYSFNQFWKNQKMAELVSTERISAEEAYPRVEEMFENMNKAL